MTIIGAPPSIIAPIDAALTETADAISDAVDEAENALGDAPGVAGMVAGIDDPDAFNGYLTTLGQDVQLLAMGSYVSRMQFNLTAGAV